MDGATAPLSGMLQHALTENRSKSRADPDIAWPIEYSGAIGNR